VRYCGNCILPDTRPGIAIGTDGVCSACRSHGTKRESIDWPARARAFDELVADTRRQGREWDCVVPVSGGKDSTWQVVTCLEHGLNPLAVTWRTPGRTELGERNLRNLVAQGVDHVDFSVDPNVERRFMVATLERVGTPAVPMHLALFNIPLRVAAGFGVPLVVWGENSALEYVGDAAEADSFELDAGWIAKYGAVHGTTAADWLSEDLTEADLAPYTAPPDTVLREREVRAVFLGMFFEWDPETTFAVAREHGFEPDPQGPRTGLYDYADIDDDFISIHHWLKWPKFGFTRLWDNLSLEIRNGRLSRDEAIEVVRRTGDQRPDEDISRFCEHVRLDEARFEEIEDGFRDERVWTRGSDGVWRIEGFLIPDWPWR
jgi:N-acetyl sugar amidotransferase